MRDFGAAMSMKEAHDETLESTMYGTDTGGERWLTARHPFPTTLIPTAMCSKVLSSISTAPPWCKRASTTSELRISSAISTSTLLILGFARLSSCRHTLMVAWHTSSSNRHARATSLTSRSSSSTKTSTTLRSRLTSASTLTPSRLTRATSLGLTLNALSTCARTTTR